MIHHPCRCHPTGRVGPRKDTPPPCRGSPVLSHPATVPSQMPLRGPESQSETISAPCQYETLESHPEALRLAYSASGPPHRHTARRSTTGHTMRSSRTAPLARVAKATRVAILTTLTRLKSHHGRSFSTAKEIGCYRVRGGGRGCDPARPPKHFELVDTRSAFPPDTNAMELSTNPVAVLLLGPPFYK